MELYILRHGIAEPREASSSKTDSERALTAEGERKMRRIAKSMKAMELTFDLILTSPLRRAKQTADIVATVLRLKKQMKSFPALVAGEQTKKLVKALQQSVNASERILIVGHEPDLSSLISCLVTGGGEMAMTLKKGGLCKLTLNSIGGGRGAVLEWLLAPSQLVRIR